MKCPTCRHENRDGALSCTACGGALPGVCPACGNENRPGARFCDHCGTPLSQETAGILASEARRGERRQLTVMFCDLVGSTALSERLDPEELRDLMREYQAVCDEAIGRFQGRIHQFLGDGILAFFGYPLAYEDDARRAVRAGLAILEGMSRLNERRRSGAREALAIRIGIHTGLVVVGELSGALQVLGETTNLAARLQGEAEANTLVISPATHALVNGYFDCRPLGARHLRGLSRPIPVFQVTGEGAAHSPLEASLVRGLHPLVGRERERRMLRESWRRTLAGDGRIVTLRGEAGIGKSRLLYECKQEIRSDGARILETRCLPQYEHTPFYPIIDLLRHQVLPRESDASPEEKWQQIEEWVGHSRGERSQAVALLSALLNLPAPKTRPPVAVASIRQQEQTIDLLLRALLTLADAGPVLLIVEDLHWSDSATQELLLALAGQEHLPGLMMVLTARPEFAPLWPSAPHLIELDVQRLDRRHVEQMIATITAGKELPPEVLATIAGRTDGVPLFVEELTGMILESGWLREGENEYYLDQPLPPMAIPTTLQDSLTARLDRLTTGRELLQLAATIGREFPSDLLAEVSGRDTAVLQKELSHLEAAGLIYADREHYLFRHALVRDAAYQSLLRRDRQRYHARIAQVLETRFADRVQAEPEVLAYHYTEAGQPDQAVLHWGAAGRQAAGCCANREAVSHLEKGLALLAGLPPSLLRQQQELDLLLALGPLKGALLGYAHPDVEAIYERAWTICQRLPGGTRLIPVLWGLYQFYTMRAEHSLVFQIGRRLLSLGRQEGEAMAIIQGHFVMGSTYLAQGMLAEGRKELEQGAYLYDPHQHRFPVYGPDPGLGALFHLATALLLQGYPEQGARMWERARAAAARGDSALNQAAALYHGALFYWWSRDYRQSLPLAEAAVQLAREKGFRDLEQSACFLRAAALAHLGTLRDGARLFRETMAAFEHAGNESGLALVLIMQAGVHLLEGSTGAGGAALDRAGEAMRKNEEWIGEAECYRLRGLFIELSGGPPEEAQHHYRRAIEAARRQESRLLELRATTRLARLLQNEGKKPEGCQLLEIACHWFTEGDRFADLIDARDLLAELRST